MKSNVSWISSKLLQMAWIALQCSWILSENLNFSGSVMNSIKSFMDGIQILKNIESVISVTKSGDISSTRNVMDDNAKWH